MNGRHHHDVIVNAVKVDLAMYPASKRISSLQEAGRTLRDQLFFSEFVQGHYMPVLKIQDVRCACTEIKRDLQIKPNF